MSTPEFLRARLDDYPRLALGAFPTPLEYLPRLSRELRRQIYIKRDDQVGPGLGGNKTRPLEYLLGDAQRAGARKVATFGGLQSNHARQTAAAAHLAGLETHLFYFERRPARLTGNLLLNEILGAHLHFVPLGRGGDGSLTIERANRLAQAAARARLGPHFFIPVGGHGWLGCLGYVRAALELDQQARDVGIPEAHVVLAAGSGATLAGLLVGLRLLGSRLCPLGIEVGRLWRDFPGSIARLATETCRRLGPLHTFTPAQVPLIEGAYGGPGYAVPTDACRAAMRRLAQAEGILLDPVYTGKAFAGLLDLVGREALGRTEPIIFLHTGGAPAIFADLVPGRMP